MMKSKTFIEKLIDAAQNHKTLYVMGCFGAPMTAANKTRYTQNHKYNRQTARTAMIKAASADTFGFDCVCLIKGILWGWSGRQVGRLRRRVLRFERRPRHRSRQHDQEVPERVDRELGEHDPRRSPVGPRPHRRLYRRRPGRGVFPGLRKRRPDHGRRQHRQESRLQYPDLAETRPPSLCRLFRRRRKRARRDPARQRAAKPSTP